VSAWAFVTIRLGRPWPVTGGFAVDRRQIGGAPSHPAGRRLGRRVCGGFVDPCPWRCVQPRWDASRRARCAWSRSIPSSIPPRRNRRRRPHPPLCDTLKVCRAGSSDRSWLASVGSVCGLLKDFELPPNRLCHLGVNRLSRHSDRFLLIGGVA
jgi:hypothetical protein